MKEDSTHCRNKWSESSETWPNRVDERHVLAIRECVQVNADQPSGHRSPQNGRPVR
jgi:hypothetical protein